MIDALLAAWALFHDTWLAGAAIAALLAVLGVWVVAREQVFLGAAVSQASTLGIATLLWIAGQAGGAAPWLGSEAAAAIAAVAASVTTAVWTAMPPRDGAESAEARTAWIFLLAASVPVLLLAHSAHGLEEVHRLMFSTLLGASRTDVWVFAGLALVTFALAVRARDPLRLLAIDPEMATAVGLRTGLWMRALAAWLGLGVGLSIRVSGLIYTFGCLVLPALVARNLCREVAPMAAVAPLVAVLTAAVAFAAAHAADVPPAHAAVALLCLLLLASGAVRRWRGG